MFMKKFSSFLMFVLILAFSSSSLQAEIKDILGNSNEKNQAQDEFTRPFGAFRMPSDPFFENFEKEMDEMLDSFKGFRGMQLPDFTRKMHGYAQGRSDVRIDGDNVVVIIDLPGHSKESIDLRIRNNELVISSERKSEQSEEEKDKFFKREISYGTFSRVIALPRKIIEKAGRAQFKDGVLKVTLPIDKEAPVDERGYKIEIE
jgi:HSP20 family protein